ncbi:CcdB family protein [Alcaligenaceae bacterium]|nr:CcdB family protein [Alcaligenaceae bacterium]
MSRYDVYANPSGLGYFLNVQAGIMQPFNTRVVVPLLLLSEAPKPAKTLNPLFDIDGVQHVMVTQYMAAVPANELKSAAFSLQHRHDEIVAAVDFLFHGF